MEKNISRNMLHPRKIKPNSFCLGMAIALPCFLILEKELLTNKLAID